MLAARIFLCLNKFTPTLGIEGDIGWDSCELRIHIAILKYWNYYQKRMIQPYVSIFYVGI